MLTDQEIKGEFQNNYQYAHDFWSPYVQNTKVYTLAASGYTWSDNEIKELNKEGREPLEFNIIRRPLQFFSGYLRDNLQSIIVSPVEGSDPRTADQFTKLMYYTWDKGDGFNVFLDSADECFKSGISLTGLYMDYSNDFVNGDIKFYKRTYNSFYLDPTFENINLKDCAFAITRDLLDRSIIKQLLPDIDPKVIDDIYGSFRDDKFLSYHPNFTNLSRSRNLMAYDQYYKRMTRTREFLVDRDSGYYKDITDLTSEEKNKLRVGIRRIKQLHDEAVEDGMETRNLPPILDIQSVERDYVELNIMINGQRVYNGEDKTGITHTYPFVANLCYFEPSIWRPQQRIQGIASTLWSAQRQFNKRHMKIIDMMDTTISTGYKYLIGSVPDPQDMQQSGQNKLIGVSPDPDKAPAGLDSVQELRGGGTNPALVEYQKILDDLTLTLSNVNESVLGIDEKGNAQISGRLAQVRIAQGLRSNRKIFDNIEISQQILGDLVIECIQNNYPPQKIQRLIGEEPTEQFYNKEFEQYQCILKEGVRSKSQRDAYYYELVNLKRDGILDVPPKEIAEFLPSVGSTRLKEVLEQNAQEEQKRQQQAEQMQMELTQATTEERQALAQERRGRLYSNIGLEEERKSEAEQNRSQAALDRAKTIVELSQMNEDRLMRVIDFVNTLERQEIQDRELVGANIERKAEEISSQTEGTEQAKKKAAMQELNQMGQNLQ